MVAFFTVFLTIPITGITGKWLTAVWDLREDTLET